MDRGDTWGVLAAGELRWSGMGGVVVEVVGSTAGGWCLSGLGGEEVDGRRSAIPFYLSMSRLLIF